MENISPLLLISFIATTIVSIVLFLKAARWSKPVMITVIGWFALQGILGYAGFYKNTTDMPPRFMLAVMPPVLFTIVLLCVQRGREFLSSFDLKTLTIIHIVRLPVELCLYALFIQKLVPVSMTFEGNNLDIISGITAPIMYYFVFVKKILGRKMLIAWNIMCIGLLLNVVIPAVLSVPYSFQQFNLDQPNIAVLYFPFIWLAAVIVPIVLFSHLTSIKNLLSMKAGFNYVGEKQFSIQM